MQDEEGPIDAEIAELLTPVVPASWQSAVLEAEAQRNYKAASVSGKLPRGHHTQGLAFGGGNEAANLTFTGESTIKRSRIEGVDLRFYSQYGKPNAKVLKVHQESPGGIIRFGPNPRHTDATTFQNRVMRWQRTVGIR